MSSIHGAARSAVVSVVFCLATGLTAAPANAQQPEVLGGNSSNSRMFWLNYDEADPAINEAIQVNTAADASARTGLNSFTFFRNTCGEERSDAIAADTNASQLILYRGAQGFGEPICASGNCPARPDGLSTRDDQLMAVATTGVGGSVPSIWTIRQNGCVTGDDKASFQLAGGGRFAITGVNRVQRIADTEFVPEDGGGLAKGDLLVLTSSPVLIARVGKAAVESLAPGGALLGTPLVSAGFFGKTTPTAMAFIPHEAADGKSPDLLVTLAEGRILRLSFSGGQLSLVNSATTWPSYELSGSQGLFQNPRGVAAGTRGGETYMVVAEQKQGRYIRAGLDNGQVGEVRTITANIESPQGVAINSYDDSASIATQCVDLNPGDPESTGCILGNVIQVHLSQGYECEPGDENCFPPGASVTAKVIPVPDIDADRDESGRLRLPSPYDDYFVPAGCRGFDLGWFGADAPEHPPIVLLDMGLNFPITPGNFILVTELASQFLGLPPEATCDKTAASIFYHPEGDPPGGILYDTTASCVNPSRSIVENFSLVAFCSDWQRLDRLSGPVPPTSGSTGIVNEEIKRRLAQIRTVLDTLPESEPLRTLRQTLRNYVAGMNPNASWTNANYANASALADVAALAVFYAKSDFKAAAPVPPDDTYAKLLGLFLALAYYTMEAGALETHAGPLAPLCEGALPELPDVQCAPAP